MATESDRRPRIGVVGVGSLGFHHARILNALDGIEHAGVYDIRSERTREVANGLRVPGRAALEDLLDAADAVVVAVPTAAHEEVAIAALSRGLHVLVEKPMAPDLEAADRILEAARQGGGVVQIGHVERFNPALRAAEAFLGRPLFVESHRMAPFSPRSTDVAVVLDLMIHDVDLVRSLVGEPIREIAALGVPVLTGSVDIASARLTFEGGAVANLTASRISTERMRKIRIFQPSGYLSLDLAHGTGEFLRLRTELPALATVREDSDRASGPPGVSGLADIVERIPIEGDAKEPLQSELESFRDAVLGLSEPAVSGEDGRAALEVTLTIEERIRKGVEAVTHGAVEA
jgi:predicted dehydrogenase